jgi:FkbM family methyltransferase
MRIVKQHEILPVIKQHVSEQPIIVEAGSFNGRDTQKLATFWPKGTVHAFEPVPEIFDQLTMNTQHLSNVCRYQLALSSVTDTAIFHVSENPEKPGRPYPAGSLLAPKERLLWSKARYTKTIEVSTITLDEWAQQHAISHIDFLWLDLQGHELAVIKSSPHILKTVKAIFCEVQFIEAYEGQPLYTEVLSWLEKEGFTAIARDFENTTNWFFGNILFTRP